MTSKMERAEDRLTDFTRDKRVLLPVVSRDNPRQVLGYLGRAAVMTARLHRLKEEH